LFHLVCPVADKTEGNFRFVKRRPAPTAQIVRAALIQINGWPKPPGPHTPRRPLDTDMMAQRTVVIVVDDDPSLLKSVARPLARHGIDSRTFSSVEALL
jgi:hypothetical protein